MRLQNGYVTKKAGNWRAHYCRYVVDPLTGKKKREQKCLTLESHVKTKTKAREELRKLLVRELGLSAETGMTVKGFITQRWQPLKEGRWRPSTAQTNKELLARITDRFGDVPLRKIDNVQLQLWLNEMAKKKSASVIKHLRIFLRSIFAEALAERRVDRDTARLLILPKMRTVLRPYLTVEEVKALLANAGTQRDLTLLRILFVTGMRPSELLALRWRDVDLRARTVTLTQTVYRGEIRPFTKTTEEGEIPRLGLPEPAVQALTEWHAAQWDYDAKDIHNGPDDYVFPAPDGGAWWKENYQRRVLSEIAKRAEVPRVNFQIIRRTVATWANSLGTLKDTQTIMRHKRAETTQNNYIQAIDATVRQTLEKLDATFSPSLRLQ
jgi:integrase